MRSNIEYEEDDLVDIVTLMEFEQGNMTEEDQIHMCAKLLMSNQIIDLPKMYTRLANRFIKEGVLDEEGSINFIKLKEYI